MSERATGGFVEIRGGYSESRNGGSVTMVTGRGNSQAQPINSQLWHDEVITYTGDLTTPPGDLLSNKVWSHSRTQDDTATSGNLEIGTAHAYPDIDRSVSTGISGSAHLYTGDSGNGDSGDLDVSTGHAVKGQAGDMTFRIGNSTDVQGYGETSGFDGGDIHMTAGLSTSHIAKGGDITLTGGLGVSSPSTMTLGGNVELHGGDAEVFNARSANPGSYPWVPTREASRIASTLWTRSTNTSEDGGAVILSGGNADRGSGGAVSLAGGYGSTKEGGWVTLTGGEARGTVEDCPDGLDDPVCDKGGSIVLTGGLAAAAYGGNVTVKSGYSTATSSGAVNVGTDNAGIIGVSGGIFIDSGHTTAGPSGDLDVKTGNALFGSGGDMRLEVGTALAGVPLSSWYVEYDKVNFTDFSCSALTGGGPISCSVYGNTESPVTFLTLFECEQFNSSCTPGGGYVGCIQLACPNEYPLMPLACRTCLEDLASVTDLTTALASCTASVLYYGPHFDGGDMVLTAGETQWDGQKGGDIYITGGLGSSNSTTDGGDGGAVFITGGESWGLQPDLDHGGNVELAGGAGAAKGGTVKLTSGGSDIVSSGDLEFVTADSGAVGESGYILLQTGDAHFNTGNISLVTGVSEVGYGGGIILSVGLANIHDDYCYCDVYGADYRGNISTYDGTNACALWTAADIASYPDAGLGSVLVTTLVSDGMGDPHNHCRNPDNSTTGPWCYDSGAAKQVCTTVLKCDATSIPECCAHAGDSDGGDVIITAGPTADNDATGGMVIIEGGAGLNAAENGGNGGEVIIRGGEAFGLTTTTDFGGDVTVTGGAAYASYGGSILLKSGFSNVTSSGSVTLETAESGTYGVSGSIALTTGYSHSGPSGGVQIDTGDAIAGQAGNIELSVGDSTELTGTSLDCYCDVNGVDYRGTVATTGSGDCLDWFTVVNDTTGNWTALNAGLGSMNITTPWNDEGLGDPHNYCRNPDRLLSAPWCYVDVSGTPTPTLCTGISRCAEGLDGVRCASTGTHHGGAIILTAGDALDLESKGGDVQLFAGDGTNSGANGGDGGDIIVHAGDGFGSTSTTDVGGSVEVLAGNATASYGGSMLLSTGTSNTTSSGSMQILTADSGSYGVSGSMTMETGFAAGGDSGGVSLTTGNAVQGRPGAIMIQGGVATVEEDQTCYCLEDGSDYRGTVADVSGAACQIWPDSWIREYPRAGLGSYIVTSVTVAAMGSPHNYCRNPGGRESGPWCWLNFEHKIWGNCTGVSQCAEGLDGTRCHSKAPSDGGAVDIRGGASLDSDAHGGGVNIVAGHGLSATENGGDGGDVTIGGGSAFGLTPTTDHAGAVILRGGKAYSGLGGAVRMVSGGSDHTSSGDISLATAHAGIFGASGAISLTSGIYYSGHLISLMILNVHEMYV